MKNAFLIPLLFLPLGLFGQPNSDPPALPDHIYIPYKDLENVLGKENQGVFLPYKDFQNLWKAAKGNPAKPSAGPPYLLSAAKFSGIVGDKLALMQLRLMVDIQKEGWVTVPFGLGTAGVTSIQVDEGGGEDAQALLRYSKNGYELLAKSPGRQVVAIEFYTQLVTRPGLNELSFQVPGAAINTLDLTLPGENLQVDSNGFQAASTSAVELPGESGELDDVELVYVLFDQCSLLFNTLDVMIKDSGGATIIPFVRRARTNAITALDTLEAIEHYKGNPHLATIRNDVDQMVSSADIAAAQFSSDAEKEAAIEAYLKHSKSCADSMDVLQEQMDEIEEKRDQVLEYGEKATKLQAFLKPGGEVTLSWAPKSQAASDLEPVLISSQNQHLRIGEALLQHEVSFNYEIRRSGIQTFNIMVPAGYRVVSVDGKNLEKWEVVDLQENGQPTPHNRLRVQLFSNAEARYQLRIRMEQFLQDADATFPLVPIFTEGALRLSGHLGLSHAPRRSAELTGLNDELVRVETSRLPSQWRKVPGISAYRFTSANYAATLRTGVVEPRIHLRQLWSLRLGQETHQLDGRLEYEIERAGVFSLTMGLPAGWEVDSLGPDSLIEDFEVQGDAAARQLTATLKKETTGKLGLQLRLRLPAGEPGAPVSIDLPRPSAQYLNRYRGQLLLHISEALRAETEALRQLKAMPLRDALRIYGKARPNPGQGYITSMAFDYSSVDAANPIGADFQLAVKPAQVSAEFFRNVDIRPGNVRHEAIIRYQVRYAPVGTFYLKYPKTLEEAGLQITGPDLKEQPLIDALPDDQAEEDAGEGEADKWVYRKIVLQSPRTGTYDLKVNWRQPFQALAEGGDSVLVDPVLAAGKLAGQSGSISVAKAANLAIGSPAVNNVQPSDPSSPRDVPYEPHRKDAVLAFRNDKPPYSLSLPVILQKEAEVYTAIVNAAIHEQALARDGALNGRSLFLLTTNRGDRLKVDFPEEAKIYAFFLDGEEVQVEAAGSASSRIVRLPPSAGQVSKIVLETTYGLPDASASELPAPGLPEGIPVQRTWWRLWVPEDHQLLTYDRNFERDLYEESLHQINNITGSGHNLQASNFQPRGTFFQFEKQGGGETLNLGLYRKEAVAIAVWIVLIAAGLFLMKVGYCERLRIALGLLALLGIAYLFQPLFSEAVATHAGFPAGIVLLLWVCQLLFVTLPKQLQAGREGFIEEEKSKPVEPPPPEDPPEPPEEKEEDTKGEDGK